MARRGKTKLGGKVDTGAMLRAGQAQEGVAAAETRRAAFEERRGAGIRQAAGAADQAIQYDVERRREQERYEAQQAQAGEQAQWQRGMAEREQGLREQQFEASLAERGLERAGAVEQEMERGEQQPALMGPPTPEQQRLREQGEKPLEMPTGRGGFVQTEARQAAAQEKRDIQRMTQETTRMRAQTAYQKAFFAQDKAAQEKAETQLSAPMRGINSKLERIIKTVQDPRSKGIGVDWLGLKEAYGDNPSVASEIEAKGRGESGVSNIVRLMRNEMAYEGLKYLAATGKMPGDDLWDPTTQLGQQFTAEVAMQGMLAATLTGGFGVHTLAEKNRQLQQRAAQTMLFEMNMKGQEQPEGPVPPPPSFGGPARGQPAPVFSQQHPGYEPREGPGGRGYAVRGLSERERQRAEQIEGVSGPPPAGTPGAAPARRRIRPGGGSSK